MVIPPKIYDKKSITKIKMEYSAELNATIY